MTNTPIRYGACTSPSVIASGHKIENVSERLPEKEGGVREKEPMSGKFQGGRFGDKVKNEFVMSFGFLIVHSGKAGCCFSI